MKIHTNPIRVCQSILNTKGDIRTLVGLETGEEYSDDGVVISDVIVWDGNDNIIERWDRYGVKLTPTSSKYRTWLVDEGVAYDDLYRSDWLNLQIEEAEEAKWQADLAVDSAAERLSRLRKVSNDCRFTMPSELFGVLVGMTALWWGWGFEGAVSYVYDIPYDNGKPVSWV